MPYPEEMVAPLRAELTRIGFTELKSAADVDRWMAEGKQGTSMLVVNSVCGCAAAGARPGVTVALRHAAKPGRVATVFAGQDLEATARARSYFGDVPPSSPSIALFKDGKLVHFVPRHMIEGRDGRTVGFDLVTAFDAWCGSAAAAR